MDSVKGSTHSFEELPVSQHELKGVGQYFGLPAADARGGGGQVRRGSGGTTQQLNIPLIEPGNTARHADSDTCGERNPQ
jgi:hypothetical protein